MNKSVTEYIFPYRAFHAEHGGDIYFHVQQFLRKLEGLLQPHVSPIILRLYLERKKIVFSESVFSRPRFHGFTRRDRDPNKEKN